MINIRLDEIANGELQRGIEKEIKKLFDNIHDEKTDPSQERAITIRIKFIPDKERENIAVETEINTKLAKINGPNAKVVTRRNPNTGQIEAKEVKSGIPGQTFFDDEVNLKTDDGEPITDFQN